MLGCRTPEFMIGFNYLLSMKKCMEGDLAIAANSFCKASQRLRPGHTCKSSISRHNPAKTTKQRVPPPQRERILQRYVAGESIVKISREEHRNRETVTRIVRSEDMERFVRAMREQLYGLAGDALVALRHSLREKKDGRLAIDVLSAIGVIPSVEDRQKIAAEAAREQTSDTGERKIVGQFVDLFCARAKMFGSRIPQFEADLNKVGGHLNSDTGKIETLQRAQI